MICEHIEKYRKPFNTAVYGEQICDICLKNSLSEEQNYTLVNLILKLLRKIEILEGELHANKL